MPKNERDEIAVRWYREADYPHVEDLVRNLTRYFDDPFDARWFRIYMEKRVLDTVPGCYVAVFKDEEVVGSIFCDILRDPTGVLYGSISTIIIKEDFRSKGIGGKLLIAAIKYLTIAGVPRIWGNVREGAENMVELFEKNGFSKKFTAYEYRNTRT
jgi:ribosomal protein S18 acetylase RimI-like enzyme